MDTCAEWEVSAEVLSSVVHELNRYPQSGNALTPLKALTWRRLNVKGFRV